MSAVTVYGLKNCDTCRKAERELSEAGKSVTFVDIRAEADLDAKVPQWMSRIRAEDLVNKRSAAWRGLTTSEQAHASSPSDAEALLIAHPTLIKRPVIEADGKAYIGWDSSVKHALGV